MKPQVSFGGDNLWFQPLKGLMIQTIKTYFKYLDFQTSFSGDNSKRQTLKEGLITTIKFYNTMYQTQDSSYGGDKSVIQ